jgi:hypothetical protein
MRVARSLAVVAFGLMTLWTSTPAAADMFGVRAGFYTKAEEPFAGAELLVPLSHSVFLNPNVEYVFTEGRTYMTFNADFHYDFPTRGRTLVWAGAGLAVLYSNPEGQGDSSTDMGANFIFGVGRRGPVVPYVQAKLIAKDDTEFVIGVGLRF